MKASLATRRTTRKKAEKVEKTSKLGSGSRFKAVKAEAKADGAKNPAAVAAAIGRRKYGATKMKQMAAAGRRKK